MKERKDFVVEKPCFQVEHGFTLIELLIVIGIIGILAGGILVSANSLREKAHRANAVSSVKSLAPYLSECSSDGGTFNAPLNSSTGNGSICTVDSVDAISVWPALPTGCSYGTMTQTEIPISCTAGSFLCTFENGSCV